MKAQRVTIAFTALNVFILLMTFFRATTAAAPDAAPILRCRELKLVDDKGRLRAELKVTPPQPNLKMPDGSIGFPESVLFRLISSTGSPHVKLGANEDGGGLVLGGDGGYVQVLSRGTNSPFVKIVTKDGRDQVLKPQ
jgi:hypothetical protein